MATDGRQLEAIVAFVEKTLLPQGFEVQTNRRIFNEDGAPIAEFDIEIRGKIGSTNIAWLIECRDRPGDGPVPGSWIEQLVGRRTRFGFNKVTAVSTTGFAVGAVEFAHAQGIELRQVAALSPEEFDSWLAIRDILSIQRFAELQRLSIVMREDESDDQERALHDRISIGLAEPGFLKSSKTGQVVAPADAFLHAVAEVGTLFDDVVPNDPRKRVKLDVQYLNDEDHYVVDTSVGLIRVPAIIFEGELRIEETLAPILVTAEYRYLDTGRQISQSAVFAPHEMFETKLSVELHRMAESGQTHIVVRKL